MPVYAVPVVDGKPKDSDRLTADSDNRRYHYRGDTVYVASKYALNVYDDMADAETVADDAVPGVADPYPNRDEDADEDDGGDEGDGTDGSESDGDDADGE